MEKCYLIVVCLDSVHYVELAESNGGYSLSAFEKKEDALEKFANFKKKIMSSSYESHISGSLGVMNLKPHIIEVPIDNPEILRKYLTEGDKPYELKGSMVGVFVNFAGIKVKEEILELSVCDVSKEYIKECYKQ